MIVYVAIMFGLAAAALVVLGLIVSDIGRRLERLELARADLSARIQACSKDLSEAVESIESSRLDSEGLNRQVADLIYTCSDLENRLGKLDPL
jgi:chromosome segregation ATPase